MLTGQDKNKMKVEIWSDIMCPFCYIGKRKFELALKQFNGASDIEIEWKSFQLSPDLKTQPGKTIHQFLSEHKGMSVSQAKAMNDKMAFTAKQVGLEYNLDASVVANSFNAHRFSHLAKKRGVQDQAEEKLFAAYFTEGKNMDDVLTLMELGSQVGLDKGEVKAVLESDAYAEEVRNDIAEAQQLGIRGVPFFVFDRKYAVSGAQETQVFLETLRASFEEWREAYPVPAFRVSEGPSCTPEGECQ